MAWNNRYKLVIRDKNGKVIQIHECYEGSIKNLVTMECETEEYSVTITKLKN